MMGGATALPGGTAATNMAVTGQTAAAAPVAAATAPQVAGAAAGASTSALTAPAVTSGLGGFLNSTAGMTLLGGAASGIGSGLMAGMRAKEEAAAKEKEQKRITDSYKINYASALTRPGTSEPQGPATSTRPRQTNFAYTGETRPRFRYDAEAGKIVFT
jgi:hypothetical protein